MKKHILIIAIGFLPNIGGLETHLKDLIDELIKNRWKVTVLTYQPLNTPVLGQWIERKKNLVILRLPVLRGLFYKFLKKPFLEFLYLEPLLFFVTPLILLTFPDVKVVNGQGLIAGFAACFWAKLFRRRYIVSAQSVYNFPKKGLYYQISRRIFNYADKIVVISAQSKKDIQSLGIDNKKIITYTNWENKNNYRIIKKPKAKEMINFKDQFVVSFFGRLVEEKGINIFLDTIKISNTKITFLIYGEGPLKDDVINITNNYKNAYYMGIISPDQLSVHYSAADLVVMPSIHEEGFGRVASGALFCGTPVIASNRGALPQVVNNSVGRIIEPSSTEIVRVVNFFYRNKNILKKCSNKTRLYALRKFSNKNANDIINVFSD